ncbi:MAG TPA: redoxin domain-containing protein [Bryobacteraceae bacterium]|nr:redoxin domain-containing protein [Bryobacteraceae bacterium]
MFCKGQLGELQRDLPLLKRAGLGLAAISYDSRAVLHDFSLRKGIAFPLLSDHESTVIRAYGVADRRYRKGTQIDVDSSGEVPVYGLADPSVFVLDPDGTVRWRFVSEHEELRLTAGSILQRAVGQLADQVRTPLEAGKIHVETTASDTAASLGSRLTIGVELRIPPGWHVYGPQVGEPYHGTAWRMDSSECSFIGDVEYPEPLWGQPAFADGKLPEYEGTIRLTREFVIRPMISDTHTAVWEGFRKSCLDSDSTFRASGSLGFQTCSDRECLPPQSVPLGWSFAFTPPDRHRAPIELWRVFEH